MAWQPHSPVAHAVYLAGFVYDPAQDIIVSRRDPFIQSRAGFTWGIDEIGTAALMVLDAETFYFQYGGRLWLLELWKGQYGIESGCEIGLYYRRADSLIEETPAETFKHLHRNRSMWYASSLDYMPIMFSRFQKAGGPFFTRGPERHWWLTGFHWGTYSEPFQIKMDCEITFDDPHMCDQFKGALTATGYSFRGGGRSVSFVFDKPKTPQTRSGASIGSRAQGANANLVKGYLRLKEELHLKNNDPNGIVLPPEFVDKIRAVAGVVAHEAQATAAAFQGGAAAVAAKLRANANAAAATIKHAATAGVMAADHRRDEAHKAYRDLLSLFKPRLG